MVGACAFAHMGVGHAAKASKLHALGTYCLWTSLQARVHEFVWLCLHFTESQAGELRPCLLGELVHGDGVGEIIHFDFLDIRAGGSLGKGGVGKVPSRYLLVVFEDISSYVWLERAAVFESTVNAAASLVCGHGSTVFVLD